MESKIGRPRSCECGHCKKCKHREYMKKWYRDKTPEERKRWVGLRDPETVKKNDRIRYYRDHDKRRELSDQYQKEHPEVVAESRRRWIERNPEKRKAQIAANNAVRDGKLLRQPCELIETGECKGRVEKHHEDYCKPLDIRWLCRKHHGIVHRKSL